MALRRPWLQIHSRYQQIATTVLVGIASGLFGGLALSIGTASSAKAASAESAPPELTAAINSMETAASARDLAAVMNGYSPSFSNEDGFTYDTLEVALGTFWSGYANLSYRVELQSWEPTTDGFLAETVTYVSGTQIDNSLGRELESVIRSQQTYQNGKIVSQKTLSERNQLTSGEQPPSVSVILVEQVESGEKYDFDAIVLEPLGDRYLLGGVIDEGVSATDFFTGRPVELELLSAGGLFKIGEAPDTPDSRWVSALLVRDDGMTVITRRLQVN
ncbi:MAG: nuclear transport factor 2 family protein [Phormidesmis sp.]